MKPWSHLPNAKLIDEVFYLRIDDVSIWITAFDAMDKAFGVVESSSARLKASKQIGHQGRRELLKQSRTTITSHPRWSHFPAEDSVKWSAYLALFAYDDCGWLLKQPPDFLIVHFKMSEEVAAHLLYPVVLAQYLSSLKIS